MKVRYLLLTLIGAGVLLGFVSLGLRQADAAPHAIGDVVINEVAWGGTAASSNDEWIELYNNTSVSVSLAGWRVATTNNMNLILQGEIAPHGYYLIERTNDTTISDITADRYGSFGSGLRNTGEIITLTDTLGNVIDTANGDGGSWPAGTTAATMERINSAAPDTSTNWATNTGNPRNGRDANGAPINGTPKCRNSVSAPAADLVVAKYGPAQAQSGAMLTYTLSYRNPGNIVAANVMLTDTLPEGVTFITSTAPYPTVVNTRTLLWMLGNVPITLTAQRIAVSVYAPASDVETMTNVITAASTVTEATPATNIARWTTFINTPSPNLGLVKLYAVQPGNYGGISGEMVALINLGADTVNLQGWCIDDKVTSTTRVCFPASAHIAAGKTLWLAEKADGFYPVWGFDADWTTTAITRSVSLLTGSWPGFTDDGEAVYLLDGGGTVVDALAYGKGSAETGWNGIPVPHPYSDYENRGQVLYRKLAETTGLPVPDTDSAADWAQDPNDLFDGRKIRYPGWDLETLFFPVVVTATGNITLAVAPDGMLNFVLDTVRAAQKSLLIEGYTLGSVPLYEAINARIQAGVQVTILLESTPAGGMSNQEKWVAQHLHQPPTSTVYFMGGNTTRYQYQHAKFMIVDNRTALLSTDNFGESSMPSDPLENGTMGHRGFVLRTDNAEVIARLNAIFRADCDPLHHNDVFPYSSVYAPPAYFSPIPPVDWTTYTVAFSPTLATTASHLTLLHAPEHTLRSQDALIGLLNGTQSGAIDVMQLNEPVTWTNDAGNAGLNPRITALIAAAQRGVSVRLLLDANYDDPLSANGNTATCLYLKGLHLSTLQCRLANVTGLGIHAKIFLVDDGNHQWVHLGSINGSETSNKANRETALQFASPAGYAYLRAVFEHDWALGHGPMIHRLYLPLTMRDYVPPVDYPLISEVFINPGGEDTGKEWIEIYHPGNETVNLTGWSLGDAINVGNYGDGRYVFPEGAQLLPRQVIVAAACATQFAAAYGFNPTYEWTNCDPLVPDMTPAGAWEGFGIALGNASDEVLLLNASATIVDSAAWGGEPRAEVIPFPIDADSTFPADASLKRYPPSYDRNDCTRDFYASYQPSPGRVSGE